VKTPKNLIPDLKLLIAGAFLLTMISFILPNGSASDKKSDSNAIKTPFDIPEITAPKFQDYAVTITDFGAVGDGHTMNTAAFAKAIAACADAGGGQVVVPAGLWLTGPIVLKSNIDLHVDQGALIIFSRNIDDFPLIRSNWEGLPRVGRTPPIYGVNLENIAITGQGIIDGSGDVWRPVKKFKMTGRQWSDLVASGGVVDDRGSIWWPSWEAMNAPALLSELDDKKNASLEDYAATREYLRPVMVNLIQCKKVLLDGPAFQNSPAWNIHPLLCEDVIIRNISVRNPWYSQNGDGLDLESCRNVLVYNSRFDVGDDAICLKSGRDEFGRKRGRPTENVSITDCIVYHGHGGFTIGSEMSGGVRNIIVRNCTFMGTDVGLRFKSARGRGGVVENIYISDILMTDIPTDAIRFNLFYEGQAPIPEEESSLGPSEQTIAAVTEETPRFQNIYMNNILCKGAARAIFMLGLPEMAINQIVFDHVFISAKEGLEGFDTENIKLTNVMILPEKGPVLSFYNSRDLLLQNVTFPKDADVYVKLTGDKTRGIVFKNEDLAQIKSKIQIGKDVRPDAISEID
jgi:polygalacturonase